jgi:hypothetical protein
LRDASGHRVKLRIRRDASEEERLSEYDLEGAVRWLGYCVEIGSSAPGGELMHLKGYLRGSSPANRLSQFQQVRRDAPGQ